METRLNRKIEAAIVERLDLFWQYEPGDDYRTVLGGYTLRAWTAVYENGSRRSRKLFQSLERKAAVAVQVELTRRGIAANMTALPDDIFFYFFTDVENSDEGDDR